MGFEEEPASCVTQATQSTGINVCSGNNVWEEQARQSQKPEQSKGMEHPKVRTLRKSL